MATLHYSGEAGVKAEIKQREPEDGKEPSPHRAFKFKPEKQRSLFRCKEQAQG